MAERTADNRIRTTEWEEIQYKHGNKVGQYERREMEIVAQKLADRHIDAPLETHDRVREAMRDREQRGHDGAEDLYDEDKHMAAEILDGEEDEDEIIMRHRRARMKALEEAQAQNRFGRIRAIKGHSYISEITEASANAFVVAALVEDNHEGCLDLLHVLEHLAAKYAHIKFVCCKSTEAIPNFPQKHLPCVVVYSGGALQHQVTSMDPWCRTGSKKPSVETVEAALRKMGVLPPLDDEEEDNEEKDSRWLAKGGKNLVTY